MTTVRSIILLILFASLIACSKLPKNLNELTQSKPVTISSLSDTAWVVDIGKALDRPSRYKLSRVEAAKEAQRRNCAYFKSDTSLDEQLDTFKGQRAYRCATEDQNAILVTEEMLLLEAL